MAELNAENRTMWTGDNLDVLRGLNTACVDLVYADPPFSLNRQRTESTGADFPVNRWTFSNVDAAWHGEVAEQSPAAHAVADNAGVVHGKAMKLYLIMMAVRLIEIRRVLKPTGSLYLHCDPHANAYLRVLLDAVFGRSAFRNEIVWHCYNRMQSQRPRRFPLASNTLLFYVRDPDAESTYTQLHEPRRKPVRQFKRVERDGRMVNARGPDGKPIYEVKTERILDNVWRISAVKPDSRERTGHQAQRPLALLDRIVKASTNPGDVVLDPFSGCATACVSAEGLKRRWLGVDLFPVSAQLVQTRLRNELDATPEIHHRTDSPRRTDLGDRPPVYGTRKHGLFGRQEGLCAGCRLAFPFYLLEVDHVVPPVSGGLDIFENQQLLCPACRRAKGECSQAELVATLDERGVLIR